MVLAKKLVRNSIMLILGITAIRAQMLVNLAYSHQMKSFVRVVIQLTYFTTIPASLHVLLMP
jgi:hypothetical protein